ncbi:hypothetical protein GTQ45_01860 [Pyruvatibacter mobilis]|uniref:Uncharacterized protein n=1 Tax=Pyruvatibacter mobilis TaxID=1712261 RepID=A0A845Q8P2_9HYPH|nr:hypothetical protein [Pyruvatibacter mobilis]NBG94476.1 hypothetical protein [Pyruvatibacter mobilis]QJD73997.1 hypothetical protein HG718_00410 [Pyruvatibacter mobilis]GGD03261.1 hypothetical protein GCM10011587_03710 [Pyruvatibacter mobilis]
MQVTIRVGALYDEVVIDGHRFDRSKLTRTERGHMAAMVRDTLVKAGRIKDTSRKPRRRRRRKPRRSN